MCSMLSDMEQVSQDSGHGTELARVQEVSGQHSDVWSNFGVVPCRVRSWTRRSAQDNSSSLAVAQASQKVGHVSLSHISCTMSNCQLKGWLCH